MPPFNEVTFPSSDNQRPWPRLSCSQHGDLTLDAVNQNDAGEEIPTTGSLRVTGEIRVEGGVTATGVLSVVGITQMGGNAEIQGNLQVSGRIDAAEVRQNGIPVTSSPWQNNEHGISYLGGYVGIGSTSPAAKLSFHNVAANTTDGITWHDQEPLNYAIHRTAGDWVEPDYQQLRLRWDTGIILDPGAHYGKSFVNIQGNGLRVQGNVGIGTETPNAKLEVKGGQTILEQENWQDVPPMQNNWHPYGSDYNPPQYFKDSQGIVHLRGLIAGGTSFGYGDDGLLFTLPQGYRPPNRQLHVVSTHSESQPRVFCGRVDVLADGRVVCPFGNAGWLCLDSISFRSA